MKNQSLNSLILLIFPIALLVLTFYRADFSRLLSHKKAGSAREGSDFLTQSRMIRASVCTFIILHHLVQTVTSYGYVYKGPVTVFNYMGVLFTALFFFFSGYGLIVSYYSKQDYLKHFFSRRILTVLIPFWVANLTGIIIEIVIGGAGNIKLLAKELLGLSLINGNGWFVIEIVLLYLIFYLTFRFLKNKDLALILVCLSVIIIIAVSFSRGHDFENGDTRWFVGEWWYNSTIAFAFGMIYGRFKDSWNAIFDKYYGVVTTLAGIFFILTFSQSIYVNTVRGYYHELSHLGRQDALMTLISQSVASLFFALFILLLSRRIVIGNRGLKLISSMSFELFLIHGYFVNQVFGRKNYSDPVFFLVVFVCSGILAYMLSMADGYLIDKSKELVAQLEDRKRFGKMGIIVIFLAAFIVLATALFSGRAFLLAKSQYGKELVALRDAKIGDEVRFGHFDTDKLLPGDERLTWIVIGREGDELRLLSKYGIAGSFYNQKHEEITWKESDLYDRLNSEEFTNIFSRYEKQIVTTDPVSKEAISLLTATEAKEIFSSDTERELIITPAALANGTNQNQKSKYNQWDMKGYRTSWWWLKGDDAPSVYAPIVTEDGEILDDKKTINKPSGAIRPVIWVRLPEEG